MKTIKQTFTIILVSVLMFTSLISNAQILKASDLRNIGREHNIFLEEVYNKLKNEKEVNSVFNLSKNVFTKHINSQKQYSKKEKTNAIKAINDFNPKKTISDLNLSKTTTDFLDKLNLIVELNFNNQKKLHNKILELETEISTKGFKNQQLLILYSATNVALSSSEYWYNNATKWNELNTNSNKVNNSCCDALISIAKADIAGAVMGAVTTWAINLVPVPGVAQLAYGVMIGSCSAGASAYQATIEFLNWLW